MDVDQVTQPANTARYDIERMQDVAQELEATFLAEMLKQARFGEARGAFGGGEGEEQFSSMLRMEHARALTERGGLGLAETIFRSLLQRAGEEP